ncbi:MAG TPA: hypothetical protein VG269_29315 [Tepidisphaeraceae bacterium]|nr:hypothetical protein [Tepidisphaeraceae bacterium]
MDDISEQLALRDSFRKKLEQNKTPAERMRDFRRLQESSWEALRRSPQGTPISCGAISRPALSMSGVPMPDNFEPLEVLRRHAVPFVIVGGHAVNHYE